MAKFDLDRVNRDEETYYEVTKYFMAADGVTALGWFEIAKFNEESDAKEYCDWKNNEHNKSKDLSR